MQAGKGIVSDEISKNQHLPQKLHKLIIRKFQKGPQYSHLFEITYWFYRNIVDKEMQVEEFNFHYVLLTSLVKYA